jgi:metal-dependent hydrolase (beta-lactamase superfamily II)
MAGEGRPSTPFLVEISEERVGVDGPTASRARCCVAVKPLPDQHWHEHATCFRLGDRSLVVFSSCGHAGIINTLRRAQEVTGVDRFMP